jgi:nucleoid-associated protein YgaU
MSSNRSWVKTLVLALTVTVLFALPVASAFAADPVNGITVPAEGATVTGTVDVKGYANHPEFAKWQLDVLPGGVADAAIFITVGTTPGEFTYSLDTTAFPAGEHALRLRVVRADSNYDEYVTKFTIGAAAAEAAAPVAEAPAAETAPVATPAPTVEATPAPAAAPANGITAPAEGATVTGTVDVKGVANHPEFAKWQLDVLPGGVADAAIFITVGTTPGEFTYSLDTTAFPAGEHALRLRVVRADSNYDEYVTKFTIGAAAAEAAAPAAEAPAAETAPVATPAPTVEATPAPAAAPANGITAPAEGATVTGTVEVKGVANHPEFAKWQLDVLPGGVADAAIFITTGTTPGEFTYSLDTTAFPAGEHALRLRVVRADSNYDEYVTKFTIAE